MCPPPNEIQIKCSILQHWRETKCISRKSIIATEYVLGSNGRRADLAIVDDSFVGVEIKSDYDSLHRLNSQVAIYEHCFDQVVVVVGLKHIEFCLKILPPHIEVWQIDGDCIPKLRRKACARIIPDLLTMSRLFTVGQLRKLSSTRVKTTSRSRLVKKVSCLPREYIRSALVKYFKDTFYPTSEAFWQSVGRRKISVQDIQTLSRFAEERVKFDTTSKQNAEYWKGWQDMAKNVLPMRKDLNGVPINLSIQTLPYDFHHPVEYIDEY